MGIDTTITVRYDGFLYILNDKEDTVLMLNSDGNKDVHVRASNG